MKLVHKHKASFNEFIGYSSKLGNPFKMGIDGDRADTIAKFEVYLRGNPELMEYVKSLPEDTVLGCYCTPKPCHGDVIIKVWKELHVNT